MGLEITSDYTQQLPGKMLEQIMVIKDLAAKATAHIAIERPERGAGYVKITRGSGIEDAAILRTIVKGRIFPPDTTFEPNDQYAGAYFVNMP